MNQMVKIDLVTGFLGSGKTTFIKKYAKHLIDEGKRIAILENDFGAINVDMMLLKELEGDNCDLEMIAGGCDYDCHVRRFKTKLIALGMLSYDRVIVEPSGIYDVDEFFDVLREEPVCNWFEIGSVITILDAGLEDNLSEEARYLLTSQLTNSGKIVLSKTDTQNVHPVEELIEKINSICEEFKANRIFTKEDFITKEWSSFNADDYESIMNAGYRSGDHTKLWMEGKKTFSSLYFMNRSLNREKLEMVIHELFTNENVGHVIRVKGFFQENDEWFEINATKEHVSFNKLPDGQDVIIVIGENLRLDPNCLMVLR